MHGEITEQELDRGQRVSSGLGNAQIVTDRGHIARVRGGIYHSSETQIEGCGRCLDLTIAVRRQWQMW